MTSTNAATLRLHLNENTAGCSPAVLEAIRRLSRIDVASYPDYRSVTQAAERWFGVPDGWVQLTNGLDDGIQAVALAAAREAWRSNARTDPEALVVEPAFEMYATCADNVGLRVARVLPHPNGEFPIDDVFNAIGAKTRVVFLNDPNNPTGQAMPDGAIAGVASSAVHALVLVDEAYAEFSGRTCIGSWLEDQRHVVVGRTFAKAFGLAGLRVGALVGHPDALAATRRVLPPYALNGVAVRALEAALEDRAYVDWYVRQSVMSRQLIYEWADRAGVAYLPSEANFVLLRIGNAAEAVAALSEAGVRVRDRSSLPGCDDCIRITAGVVETTRAGLLALEAYCASRAR